MKSTDSVKAYFSSLGRMRMLGGSPALDLANTLHWRDGELADFVPDYGALARFCIPAGLLAAAEAKAALKVAAGAPAKAAEVHAEVLALRRALKDWLQVAAENLSETPARHRAATAKFAAQLARAAQDVTLATILPQVGKNPADAILSLPRRRLAGACALLLLYPPQGDIRQCEADHCGGFFINQSRSKPRRWCSMDGCGNRAKAARFRHAHRPGHGLLP